MIRSRRHSVLARLGACLLGVLALAGCALPSRSPAVPADLTDQAVIPGIPDARFRPTTATEDLIDLVLQSAIREFGAGGIPDDVPPAHLLAVSGGAEDGAFGAGLLVGWSELGTRPEFKVVTGVSTGALIAPFAFLGPDYDDELQAVYTQISGDDVFEERGILAAVLDDALADTSPLRALIEFYADEAMFRAIAEEYGRGRLLMIATTDLDARTPVVWNIGAIAASGDPNAYRLFHDILIASSAVPAAFPPVMIDVEVNGAAYQEMHVDGGAISQVFVYPPALTRQDIETAAGRTRDVFLYVIRNARLDAEWASTERVTLSIAARAVSSLIQSQGIGDLYRIYLTSQRDGVDFNLAFIGPDFDTPLEEPFDPTYMRALYDYGYALGRSGYPWQPTPPGFQAVVEE